MEAQMDDIRGVRDAAGCERAVLFGIESGAVLCFVFAATYPERTSSVVVFGAIARGAWAPDYPWGWTEGQFDSWIDKEQREWRAPGKLPPATGPSATGTFGTSFRPSKCPRWCSTGPVTSWNPSGKADTSPSMSPGQSCSSSREKATASRWMTSSHTSDASWNRYERSRRGWTDSCPPCCSPTSPTKRGKP